VCASKPGVAERGCAKCARLQKTCCQQAEILLTAGDLERIRRYTGQSDFWEDRVPSPEYLDQDDDPNWNRYVLRPDGTRRVLKRSANGDCGFLTECGCRLPVEVRPVVCRLYPYDYTEAGLRGVDDHYCPTAQITPPGRTLLEVLDMRLADAQRWHRLLYEELRTGKPCDESRTHLRPA
jgi:Fe-S-cluster containining protein